MDDPYPSSRLVILAGADAAAWITWVAAILAFLLAASRRSLEAFSRARMLEELPSPAARKRFESYFLRIERSLVGSALLLVTAEVLFVLGLAQWLSSRRPFGLPNEGVGFLVTCSIPAALFLVPFCQVIPRALARSGAAEMIVRRALPPLHYAGLVLTPLIWPLERLRHRVVRIGTDGDADNSSHITEGILSVVEAGEREGVIHEDEADMIESIIEFRDVEVSQIMTPRTDMVAFDADTPIPEVIALVRQGGPSRIPVYEDNVDHIIGLLYVKDLLAYVGEEAASLPKLRDIARPATFIPETKKVGQLLREFRAQKVHIAIILDEYGGTAGLVTIEDILEEIVGDIADEYDTEPAEAVRRIDGSSVEVDARVRLDELNEILGIELPESDDFDTVGGFVFSSLGKVPKEGETFTHDQVELRILAADDRRVKRVLVRVPQRRE
ncbi:MAG: hemolysin family protein [Planctomycetota bacterium]